MRKAILVAVAAAAGVGAVVLPAVAGSETSPTVTAVNGSGVPATHSWSPPGVTVGEGGSVTFSNPTTVPHGVEWVSTPATPVCGGGVPVGTTESASGTQWTGSCTFTRPGTYTFYCTVHGASMSGTVTVTAPSGEPPATTTTTTPTTMPGGPGSTTSAPGQAPGAGGQGAPAPGAGAGAVGSPFAGGAAALKLVGSQRGSSVRGTVNVSAAGAGGALEVDLLAKGASLARKGAAGTTILGRLERGTPVAGPVRFAVPLNARGKRALRRRGRLTLTVAVELTPRGGRAVKLERPVVLRSAH